MQLRMPQMENPTRIKMSTVLPPVREEADEAMRDGAGDHSDSDGNDREEDKVPPQGDQGHTVVGGFASRSDCGKKSLKRSWDQGGAAGGRQQYQSFLGPKETLRFVRRLEVLRANDDLADLRDVDDLTADISLLSH